VSAAQRNSQIHSLAARTRTSTRTNTSRTNASRTNTSNVCGGCKSERERKRLRFSGSRHGVSVTTEIKIINVSSWCWDGGDGQGGVSVAGHVV
jgi:hypothetical protein